MNITYSGLKYPSPLSDFSLSFPYSSNLTQLITQSQYPTYLTQSQQQSLLLFNYKRLQPSTMPEAITYNDMRRRIAGAFTQKSTPITVICLARNFGNNCLTGIWGQQLADGTLFDHTLACELHPDLIVNHGKQLLIPLRKYNSSGRNIPTMLWMKVTCMLHGHVLPITEEEGSALSTNIITNIPKPDPPFALILLRNKGRKPGNEHSVAVVDRNRLTAVHFFEAAASVDITLFQPICSHLCTMTQYPQWRKMMEQLTNTWARLRGNTSIFTYMLDNQAFFNGVGTSHASEILHLAALHPAHMARMVLSNPALRKRLLDAVGEFYNKARSDEYKKHVPATSSGSAFFESPGITRYYNQMFHQVYGRSLDGTFLTTAQYDRMVEQGRLAPGTPLSTALRSGNRQPRPTQKKRVPVYCIKLRKSRGIAFTVFWLPDPKPVDMNSNAEQLSYTAAASKATSSKGGRAEIGIASFMDTKAVENAERTSKARALPLREGNPGRPKLSRTFRTAYRSDPPGARQRKKAVWLRATAAQIAAGQEPQSAVEGDQEVIDLVEVVVWEGQEFNAQKEDRQASIPSRPAEVLTPLGIVTGARTLEQEQNFIAEARARVLQESGVDASVAGSDNLEVDPLDAFYEGLHPDPELEDDIYGVSDEE